MASLIGNSAVRVYPLLILRKHRHASGARATSASFPGLSLEGGRDGRIK